MNKRHYEHTLPNIRGSLSNTYSGRQTDDTGENYNGGQDNRMQKAEREIRDKTSGGKEQESLTRRK